MGSLRWRPAVENLAVDPFDAASAGGELDAEPRRDISKKAPPRISQAHSKALSAPLLATREDVGWGEEKLWSRPRQARLSGAECIPVSEAGTRAMLD